MTFVTPLNALSLGDAAEPASRPRWLARRRYQLLGALILAVVFPAFLRPGLDVGQFLDASTIGNLFAVLLGAYLLRRMTAFPGVSTISMLLPAFGVSYAGTILVLSFARIEYSRVQFIASLVAAGLWFVFIGLVEPRLRRARLLLVPFGRANDLLSNTQAEWRPARTADIIPPDVSGVVADLRAELSPEWQLLLARAALAGLPVYHWKQVAESLSGMVDIEHLSENNLGSLLPSSIYLRVKYFLDVMMACAALPFVLLSIGAAAVAIKLTDGGPVFFRQKRMGFRGRPFMVFKLRTMRCTQADGLAFTEKGDPRITRVGRFLRAYHVDELPQVFNILRGEMSWIGPRPESIQLATWYEDEVPFYSYRHIVRPGITGWAQVLQGNVAKIEAATRKLHFDFYYIKYFSPWLDVLIVARTLRALFTRFGSH